MPGESTLSEKVVALRTWREEHEKRHEREDKMKESGKGRRNIVIAAIVGAVVGAVISGVGTYLICIANIGSD